MNATRTLTVLTALTLAAACTQKQAAPEPQGAQQPAAPAANEHQEVAAEPDAGAPAAAPKKLDGAKYDHFGDGITVGAEPMTLDAALAKAAELDGETIRVQAPITGVCQVKGCWMNLGAPKEDGTPSLFVKFKDYGFFMPKDASGRTAIVEGTMTFEQETVAQTKHYLEDAGKHDEAAKVTEGRKLYRFMANGVALEKAAAK